MIIVIEGGDQAGKKTQSLLLQKKLQKNRIKTKLFSFPDTTTRSALGNPSSNFSNHEGFMPFTTPYTRFD